MPFPFQKNTWDAYQQGKSGLVHAPTGTGKTYAVWTPTLLEWMSEQKDGKIPKRAPHLRVLWLTPLRALVEDTTRTLEELSEGLGLPWSIQSRTGDTSGSVKLNKEESIRHAWLPHPRAFLCSLIQKPVKPSRTCEQ